MGGGLGVGIGAGLGERAGRGHGLIGAAIDGGDLVPAESTIVEQGAGEAQDRVEVAGPLGMIAGDGRRVPGVGKIGDTGDELGLDLVRARLLVDVLYRPFDKTRGPLYPFEEIEGEVRERITYQIGQRNILSGIGAHARAFKEVCRQLP